MSKTVSNTEDGTYTITATATPLYSGTYTEGTSSCDAQVIIFNPVAEYQDSTIYLGQSVTNYETENFKSLDWKNSEGASSSDATMYHDAPTITYSFSLYAGAFTDCTIITWDIFQVGSTPYTEDEASTFTVHVLKPTVTWSDTEEYYGNNISTTGFAPTGAVTWSDTKAADATHTPSSEEAVSEANRASKPALTFTYGIGGNLTVMPDEDVNVTVTATINGTDVTSYVTFGWIKNDSVCGSGCTAAPDGAQFRIHPQFCTLTITKSGAADIDENQSFIFTVARTGGNPVTKTIGTTVTIQGNNSVTITGLPVGSYTVTEDGGWSWRYKAADGSGKAVTLQPPTSPESVTVINERKEIYWLDGNSWAINNWAATGDNRKKQSPKT